MSKAAKSPIEKQMAKLQSLSGAITNYNSPHLRVIRTPSPSLNAMFGNGWGLPIGFTWVLFGQPKDGKSLVVNSTMGQLHRDDPEAVIIKFDTEFRDQGQLGPEMLKVYGIDPKRYICFQVNSPAEVFDRITKDIHALIQDGLPVRLIVIDSVNGIQGRRRMVADSVESVTIGDLAQTLQDGMKAILPVQRDMGGDGSKAFAVICTSQVRSEMDPIEQKRLGSGPKVKMAASWGFKHYAEYFTFVRRNKNKEGREDLLGRKYEANGTDIAGKSENTAFRIMLNMRDSSIGPIGRSAEFTFSIDKGVINTAHEVFLMAMGRGVITRSGMKYTFMNSSWAGKEAVINAFENDPDLCKAAIKELHKQDLAGQWRAKDIETAKAAETSLDDEEKPEVPDTDLPLDDE